MKNNKISKKDLAILCSQIYFLLDGGISISKAIEILISQQNNKVLKAILHGVHKNILEGKSFSTCLLEHKNYFPALMINMIKAGEESGNLNYTIRRLSEHYELEYKFIAEFKRAMIYPIIICVMMLCSLILALTLVIPGYEQLFSQSDAQLPMLTKIIIGASDFVRCHYLFWIGIFLLLLLFIKQFFKTNKGQIFYGKLILSPPIKNIYWPWLNFTFASGMGMLLDSGMNIIFVLDNLKNIIANKFLDTDFNLMIDQMKNGMSISKVVCGSKKFHPVLEIMIKIGEDSGNLSGTMAHCQSYFQNEFANNLSQLQKLIEPALTILIGIILAVVMIAIMEPTFMIGDIL